MSKLLIIFLVSFISINCLIEEPINLELTLSEVINKEIGKKGTLFLDFEQKSRKETIKIIKRNTCFKMTLAKDDIVSKVDCGLINSVENNQTVIIFCNIRENIPPGENKILLSEMGYFLCGDYKIILKNEERKGNSIFTKTDKDICDLYGDEQTITIENAKNDYELKFNIVSYNKEILIFNRNIILDKCQAQNDILVCPITKSELLSHLSTSYRDSIEYLNTKDDRFERILFSGTINITVKDIPKKDIFVGINKLLTNITDSFSPFVYETNITDISNYYNPEFNRQGFKLNFTTNDWEREANLDCTFAKYDNISLLLLCLRYDFDKVELSLKEIKEEIKINDKYFLYNYRIQPVKIEEKILLNGTGSFFYWYYPKVLDFSKSNDKISIYYYSHSSEDFINGLTYNENEKDLQCETIKYNLKKCYVTKEHFKGKKDGLYFLKHKNYLGKKSISYEIPPIKVILSSSKGNIISLSLFYSLIALLIMI